MTRKFYAWIAWISIRVGNLKRYVTERRSAVARVTYSDGEKRYFDALAWDAFSDGIERMERNKLVRIKTYE
jgi:hypothetical protein